MSSNWETVGTNTSLERADLFWSFFSFYIKLTFELDAVGNGNLVLSFERRRPSKLAMTRASFETAEIRLSFI